METDFVCPQRSQDNIEIDSRFTENKQPQEELEKQHMEATCGIERVESPPQPDGAHTSLPAGGAVEPNMKDLNNAFQNEGNSDQAQEWPPVPELEDDRQTERDECQEGVKTNNETSDDALTLVQDADGVEHINMTQMSREEEGCSVEHPLDDSDSIVFVSENSEEKNTDCEPVAESSVDAQNIQQEEQEERSLNENEEEQQVCADAPPLDTVTGEPANPERKSPSCSYTEDKEPLPMTVEKRDGEREEGRERAETGEERKQTGGAEEERRAEVKDQRQVENKGLEETETHPNTKTDGKVGKMDVDDSQSDSGVSADFSPNSVTDASDCPAIAPALSESPPNETPIEREIRLAMLREQNLRRARGLDDAPDRTKEFVEIPVRKPILSQDPKPSPSLGKDRQFAGKKMLMEISAEAEREKVLVLELGRLPGFYDKGTEVQVQEKKLLFEALQDPNGPPNGRSTSNGEQAAGIQDFDYSVDIKQRQMQFSQNPADPPAAAEPEGQKSDPTSAVGPGLTEATTAQVIIIETTPIFTPVQDSNRAHETTSRTDGGSTTDEKVSSSEPQGTTQRQSFEDKDDVDLSLVKENPFFKLRSSALLSQVEQDIKETKERERELQMQRTSVYGGAAAVEPKAERKIEGLTEVDSGMGEKTESRVEETTTPSEETLSHAAKQINLSPTTCQSEASTTPTSVRQSTGKLELTWPPPQTNEEKQQSEKASRTPRQRNPLLDRWESGMVNGHVEDSN